MQATAFCELAARSMRVVVMIVLVVGGMPPASAGASRSPMIDRITLRATGSIWGQYEPGVREIVVERRGDWYVVGDRPVPTAAVTRIADDLTRPPVTVPTLESLRLPDGLLASVEDACGRSARAAFFPKSGNSPSQEAPDAGGVGRLAALLRKLCIDPASVDAAVRSLATWSVVQEGPHILMEVRYDDGSVVSTRSSDESMMLLPWEITRGGARTDDYDADLGLAIADVLPDGFSLRNHLRGDGAGAALGHAIGATSQQYQRAEFGAIFGNEALAVIDATLAEPMLRVGYGVVVSGHPRGSRDTVTFSLAPRSDAAAAIVTAALAGTYELETIRRTSTLADALPNVSLGVYQPTTSDDVLPDIAELLRDVPMGVRSDPRYGELRASVNNDVFVSMLDALGASVGYAIVAPTGAALLARDRPAIDEAMPDTCVPHRFKQHTLTCRTFADPRPG